MQKNMAMKESKKIRQDNRMNMIYVQLIKNSYHDLKESIWNIEN